MNRNQPFRALVVRESMPGTFTRRVEERHVDELPLGDLLIRVRYSSLNYKDALSASGHRGVTRHYPHTPGIDAAGVVEESQSPAFQVGDEVIVIGYDLGMDTPGGFGQFIRVPAGWAVHRPAGLSLRESMIYGTAGFTAAMCVERLMDYGIDPGQGEILVTGATGGVGSVAVALLALEGYTVVAATGKLDQASYLQALGAAAVIHRQEVDDASGRPLLKGRWAGVVDTVGGNILATAIRATRPQGCVTCCGNAASPELHLTVYPFILRGVALLGIDAGNCPIQVRRHIWQKLATRWKLPQMERLVTECSLQELSGHIDRILAGEQVGRVLVNLGQ